MNDPEPIESSMSLAYEENIGPNGEANNLQPSQLDQVSTNQQVSRRKSIRLSKSKRSINENLEASTFIIDNFNEGSGEFEEEESSTSDQDYTKSVKSNDNENCNCKQCKDGSLEYSAALLDDHRKALDDFSRKIPRCSLLKQGLKLTKAYIENSDFITKESARFLLAEVFDLIGDSFKVYVEYLSSTTKLYIDADLKKELANVTANAFETAFEEFSNITQQFLKNYVEEKGPHASEDNQSQKYDFYHNNTNNISPASTTIATIVDLELEQSSDENDKQFNDPNSECTYYKADDSEDSLEHDLKKYYSPDISFLFNDLSEGSGFEGSGFQDIYDYNTKVIKSIPEVLITGESSSNNCSALQEYKKTDGMMTKFYMKKKQELEGELKIMKRQNGRLLAHIKYVESVTDRIISICKENRKRDQKCCMCRSNCRL